MTHDSSSGPLLLLTQGHAGDRLGARLVPALRRRFPEREIVGIGGEGMARLGVRLLARTDGISVMGWTGLVPQLPRILWALCLTSLGSRRPVPACVVAVDIWQPLQVLHRQAQHLHRVPHVCYLPPAPNFISMTRVHHAVSRVFRSIITPFPHQARLYAEAGGNVRLGAHAGLQACREEAEPRPWNEREPVLALLPGSRALEVRHSLRVQVEAARRIREQHPELVPVACCANEEVAHRVAREFPGLERSGNAREVMARARFALICSGTAALEAALFGCPGVVTYHGSRLQRWEWETFHVEKLARLRAAGIASPFVSLPNILAGEELYPECLGVPAGPIAEAALRELATDPATKRAALDRVANTLSWEDAGEVVAGEVAAALAASG